MQSANRSEALWGTDSACHLSQELEEHARSARNVPLADLAVAVLREPRDFRRQRPGGNTPPRPRSKDEPGRPWPFCLGLLEGRRRGETPRRWPALQTHVPLKRPEGDLPEPARRPTRRSEGPRDPARPSQDGARWLSIARAILKNAAIWCFGRAHRRAGPRDRGAAPQNPGTALAGQECALDPPPAATRARPPPLPGGIGPAEARVKGL